MTNARRSSQAGFTLIEVLVVAALFSLAVLMSTDVFITASRSQRRAQTQQRVQADARFTLETIAREIRSSIPDYELYSTNAVSLTGPTHILALCDGANIGCDPDLARTIIRQVSTDRTNAPWAGGGDRLEICSKSCSDPAQWSDLTPTDVTLTRFEVFVTPQKNPFLLYGTCSTDASILCRTDSECAPGTCADINEYRVSVQPAMTVILTVREQGQASSPDQVYQMTVASRLYLR